MCLGVPGKIIEIDGDKAIVNYDIEKREVMILDEQAFKIGDYVIVQGGFVTLKVSEKEAIEALKLYKETQEI